MLPGHVIATLGHEVVRLAVEFLGLEAKLATISVPLDRVAG